MALVPALKRIPREILDQIIKHVNPVQSVAFTASTSLEAGDELIWSTIFANDDWLEVARTKGAKPALLGPNLSSIVACGRKREHVTCNVLLLAFDWSGDVQYQDEQFFSSLRPHYKMVSKNIIEFWARKMRVGGQTYELPRILLNVKDALEVPGSLRLPEHSIASLLQTSPVCTQYCFAKDHRIHTLASSSLVGIGGAISDTSKRIPICNLQFPEQLGLTSWQRTHYTLHEYGFEEFRAIRPSRDAPISHFIVPKRGRFGLWGYEEDLRGLSDIETP